MVRQDYIRKDTLRTFVTLNYDSLNRLVRKINHNTKHGKGFSFGSGFTKDGKVEKILDPNDTTFYKHKISNDTLITAIYRKGKLRIVEKKLSINNLKVKISENHRFGYVSEREIKYIWADSSRISKERYNKYGKIRRYSYSSFNSKRTISRNSYMPSYKKSILKIKTKKDSYDNWIRKEYIRDNIITNIIIRKIEYFDD